MGWRHGIVAAIGLAAAAIAPAGAQDFEYPATGRITGKLYYCGGSKYHGALDIAGACWSCIYAARGGTAYYYGGCGQKCTYNYGSTCNGGAGNYVRITHGGGYATRYLHGLSGTGVSGSVADSRKILKRGSTGNSTGAHVHFDIWRYGSKITGWLSHAAACGTTVYAGRNIPHDFPGIGPPGTDHAPHGCN